MLSGRFEVDEVNALICLLHTQGIAYLIGSASSPNEERATGDPVHLLQRLAGCKYPLVENATISLLLLHPDLASSVNRALQESEPELAENLAVLTLATLYHQQWWLFRLTFALGSLPCFPEHPFTALWEKRHLPPPSRGYGQSGLLALQAYQQQRYGISLNFLGDWQNQIDHLLAQEESHQHQLTADVREALLHQERKETMSMRQSVGQEEIELFLVQLGRTRHPGRLYLVGGAALVHRGIRPGQTLDIDIHITVDSAHLISQITQLKQKLNINIEFASPADFMPLPADWETRSQFIQRYGQADAFYFDW